MPIPTFMGLPPEPTKQEVVDKINRLASELQNLLLNLDSLNVVHLTAETIDTGTLNANLVTILSQLLNGGFIRLDGNGIVINDGTQDTFVADFSGNVTLKGIINALGGVIGGFTIGLTKLSGDGIIEGGTIRTGPTDVTRIEMSEGGLRGVTSEGLLSGLVYSPTPEDIMDLYLYHRGAKLLEFYDGFNYYAIRPTSEAVKFELGGPAATTYPVGSWIFSSASSVTGIPQSAVTNLVSNLSSINTNLSSINSILSNHETRISALESRP